MSGDTQSVDAEMSIIDLAQLFLESGFRRYPVVHDNHLIGVISRRDVLRALGQIASG
jgi:CBS domain-containing protein